MRYYPEKTISTKAGISRVLQLFSGHQLQATAQKPGHMG
jgi:hypothetical protein